MCKKAICLCFVLTCFSLPSPSYSEILEVGNGSYSSIQDAIAVSSHNDTVLVHDGIYNESINFNGKSITVRSVNGPEKTVINPQNSDRVVTFSSFETTESVLDGFTLKNGDTSTLGIDNSGGGIYCGNSSPTIKNCIITNNSATTFGGGVVCYFSSPKLINCVIANNTAKWGGGVMAEESDMTFVNCTIADNNAEEYGGGVGLNNSSMTMLNSIVWNNSRSEISVFSDRGLEIEYSNINGGATGTGNIDMDPMFIGNGNYRLKPNSPSIDKGDPQSSVPDFPKEDINGNTRPEGLRYDMGAYEQCKNQKTYYLDADNDGFGDPLVSLGICDLSVPEGYVLNKNDCDDSDYMVKPGAEEICNAVDDNCDGVLNEGFPNSVFYFDADGDGFGNTENQKTFCTGLPTEGYIANSGDCDDDNAAINPEAEEVCNEADDNCDGAVNEGFPQTVYYLDSDGDGFGDMESPKIFCSTPISTEYVLDNTDCDDSNPLIYPKTYYKDSDNDTFGDPNNNTTVCQTVPPDGYVENNLDCNDKDHLVKPETEEICGDDIDQNCNGVIDEECPESAITIVTPREFYADDQDLKVIAAVSEEINITNAVLNYYPSADSEVFLQRFMFKGEGSSWVTTIPMADVPKVEFRFYVSAVDSENNKYKTPTMTIGISKTGEVPTQVPTLSDWGKGVLIFVIFMASLKYSIKYSAAKNIS